ncbi:transcription elongation factor 1 [Babesia caballi]|uniref:Transcription elongation factor 1 homolog n=1 Tax=Babesia caballi TaxID=5871 RepID=A0AAV4LZF9_BABCB|nr:transcription elongation factor 1 [Babesia caballi]
MAKRKTKKAQLSRAQIMQKRRGKLEKEFLCFYCQHEKSVAVKIDNQSGMGFLTCRVCGVKFSTRVTVLDEAIDVYAQWMDSCREGQQKEAARPRAVEALPAAPAHGISPSRSAVPKTTPALAAPPTAVVPATTPASTDGRSKSAEQPPKRPLLDAEFSSASFSTIGGGKRSKRIIDALEETPDEPEFTVGTITGENLFDDD